MIPAMTFILNSDLLQETIQAVFGKFLSPPADEIKTFRVVAFPGLRTHPVPAIHSQRLAVLLYRSRFKVFRQFDQDGYAWLQLAGGAYAAARKLTAPTQVYAERVD